MKNLLVLTLCIILGLSAQAQEDMMFTASRNSLIETNISINNNNEFKSPETTSNKIGAFGELLTNNNQEDFTGFSIKLLTTTNALPEDANVFYFFGDVKVEQTSRNEFNYIVGNFKTKQAAKKFMDTYLMQHYTSSTIIEYKNGERQ